MTEDKTLKLRELFGSQIYVIKTREGHYSTGINFSSSDETFPLRSFDEVKERLLDYSRKNPFLFIAKPHIGQYVSVDEKEAILGIRDKVLEQRVKIVFEER